MSSPDSKEINLVRCLKCGKILKCSRYDTAALLEHIHTDHPEVDIIDTDTKQKRHSPTESTKFPPKSNRYSSAQKNKSREYSMPNDEIEKYECSDDECNLEESNRSSHRREDVDRTHYSINTEILDKYPEIRECEYCPHNPNAQVVYTRRYKLNTPSIVSKTVLQRPFQRSLYYTSIEKWSPVNGTIHCPKCGCNKRPLIKTRAERFTYSECGTCCLLSCWPFCFLPFLWPTRNFEYLYCANCKTFLGLYDHSTNCIKPNRLYVTIENCDKYDYNQTNGTKVATQTLEPTKTPEPPPSFGGDSAKSNDLPSIVVDGKEVPPETVQRLQKLKKYSSWAGIDLEGLTSPTNTPNTTQRDNDSHKEKQNTVPSVSKPNRESV
ncbi:uncharacterized protein ACRADG_010546 [Cochliomyia hominivorax]